MSYKYNYLVFIGRFQPFHIGHKAVIEEALTLADKVIVLIGSSGKPRSIKNPWTHMERMGMIFDGMELKREDQSRVIVAPLHDRTYNDQMWVGDVQAIVENQVRISCIKNPKIGIIGHAKDDSSFYLKLFPQWELVNHELNEPVHATDLRSLLFEGKSVKYLQGLLPPPVFRYVEQFSQSPDFTKLVKEYIYIKNYKDAWKAAPRPVNFVTVDAVVVQSGHILMVERRAELGVGLMALPGGFVKQTELIVDGCVRELREETKLKVPIPVLKGSIKAVKVYDAVDRSARGRVITHAFLIELPPGELPPVKGSDDAKKAMWVPIVELDEGKIFEDHWAIIQNLLGRI